MKLLIKLTVFLFLSACLFSRCNKKKEDVLDMGMLIKKYSENPSDSLKLECARFLQQNMLDLTSEQVVFYSTLNNQQKYVRLDTISSEEKLKYFLSSHYFSYTTQIVPDSIALTNELIEKNISKAIDDWNKYPWNKNIPKTIFLNYLLPYKIFDENPEDWRSFFYGKYKDSLIKHINNYLLDTSNIYNKDPNELYYQIIVNETGNWFVYKAEYHRLCSAPSFNELMCLRQGDCLRTAYLNTYILRSMGMPCAIDIVPLWGSRNGWHANEVFWDGKSSMRTPSGRSFDRPAKVFRLSFKQQNIWKDSIKPFIGIDSFLLPNLQNNHWQDVTYEHTTTKDITYHFPDTLKNIKYAYICVYNYGEWKPIFWGKVDNTNTVQFKNMGCQMLYQVALPFNNTYALSGNIFMVNRSGNISYRLPNFSKKQNMVLSKLNTGALSYLKKGEKYSLYMLTANNTWQVLQTQYCIKDSTITIKNMPSNAFYKLLKINASQRLERIFTYNGNKQIWW